MKKILGLIACALTGNMLYSQSQPMALEEWKATVGTQTFFYKNVTQTDASGFIYVAGATLNANGKEDILIAKYNSEGAQQWIKQFNGNANDVDFATAIFISGGYVYLTGTSVTSTVTPLTSDRIVIKYDAATGAQQWVNLYDGAAHGNDIGGDISVNSSNEIFVTGSTATTSGMMDYLTQKISSTGTTQWTAINDYNSLMDAGMKIKINASSVDIGGVVQVNSTQYGWKTYIYATSTGSLLATSSGSSSVIAANDMSDMVKDAAGNMYLCGSMTASGQGLNYYVVKLNSTAVLQWVRNYNGAANLDDVAKGIKVDAAGNVYVTGYSTTALGKDFVTIRYSSTGVQQWVKVYNNVNNGNDEANDLVLDASGNIYVTGYTTTSPGNPDYFTIKYDNSNNVIWSITTDGGLGLNDKATNIALDASNNVFISGQSQTSANAYKYLTVKYVQKDVITPVDYNGETPSNNFSYYTNTGQLINTNNALIPDYKFYSFNTNPAFYIKNRGSSFVFAKNDTISSTPDTLHRIDLNFSNPNNVYTSQTYPMEEKRTGYLNYFLAHTGTDGIAGVYGNKRLITKDLYTNIDLMYTSNQNGIKYYFIVKPGGNIADIQMAFTGAQSFNLNASTNALTVSSSIGSITYDRPTVYQLSTTNTIVPVTGWTPDWQTNGAANTYKFNTGTYNTALTLVIEVDLGNSLAPTTTSIDNMNYSTYYGGSNQDYFKAVKVNQTNNRRYVAGYTTGAAFPQFNGFVTYSGSYDAVVLGYTGTDTLLFSTFYGGTVDDIANSIAIQSNGNIYIAGQTGSINLPISTFYKPTATQQTANQYDYLNTLSTQREGFILELNSNGNTHVWSRYVGGVYSDGISDIAIDNSDNLYVVGNSNSGNFPITAGAYKTMLITGSSYVNNYDWVVMKMNSQSQVQWSTFYGGNNLSSSGYSSDAASCVDVDNVTGWVYVGGSIGASTDFPTINTTGNTSTTSFYKSSLTGTGAALVRFNSSGTPQLSMQLGSVDNITDLKVLTDRSLLMVGMTTASSSSFSHKVKPGAYNKKYFNSNNKGYILQMNSNIDSLWSTFYNKANVIGDYSINRIAAADNGAFCLSGVQYTDSLTLPVVPTAGMYSNTVRKLRDGFISYFDANGQLYHAHYLGGNNFEDLGDIAIYKHQNVYAVGTTEGTFPTASTPSNASLIDATYNNNLDGFVTRFDISFVLTLTKENDRNNKLSINPYPNPVENYFMIDAKDISDKNFVISLYDITGKEIYTERYNNYSNEYIKVNCDQLSQGMYLVNIKTKDAKFSGKIIKQ